MRRVSRPRLLPVVVLAVVAAIGVVAGQAQASGLKDPTRSSGQAQKAAVGTKVTSGVATTTYTFSTATSPINGYWNQGYWSTNASDSNDNTNYFTGSFGGLTGRGYFTFDVSGGAKACAPTSAYLSVPTGSGAGPSTLSLGLFDVGTDPGTLAAKVNNPNTTIYTDLGSGSMYGGPYSLPTSVSLGTFKLYLNDAGEKALFQATQNEQEYFSIGMGLINPPGGDAYLFGYTGYAPVTLTASYPRLCRVT